MNEFDKKDVKLTELTRQYNRSISFVIFLVNVVFDELWIANAENFLELIILPKDDIPMNRIGYLGERYQRVPRFDLDVFLNRFLYVQNLLFRTIYLLGHLL